MDDDLAAESGVWRVIAAGYATLIEIERDWSYDDLRRAVAVLDMRRDMESAEAVRTKQEARRRK